MYQQDSIQIFEEKKVWTVWDADQEKWFFSIVDVVAVLTVSPNAPVYWRVLKKRLKDEGNETVTNCNALKLQASDGKMRMTDVADTEPLFRLIKSISSNGQRYYLKFCFLLTHQMQTNNNQYYCLV